MGRKDEANFREMVFRVADRSSPFYVEVECFHHLGQEQTQQILLGEIDETDDPERSYR